MKESRAKSLVWDFRKVPLKELRACFLYEYARESCRIRTLAKRLVAPNPSTEPGSPYMLLEAMMRVERVVEGERDQVKSWVEAARVLDRLSRFPPRMDLERISWFDYGDDAKKAATIAAARECAFRPLKKSQGLAFSLFPERPLLTRWGWEDRFSRQNDRPEDTERIQIEAFEISWCEGLEAVLEDARTWIEANRPRNSYLQSPKKGRHAKPESFYRDGLRQLGAMRLLSVYPLKKAISIGKGYQPNGDSIYSGFIDGEGRPQGQTAWDNAIKNAVKSFRMLFRTDHSDGPISFHAYKSRQRAQMIKAK